MRERASTSMSASAPRSSTSHRPANGSRWTNGCCSEARRAGDRVLELRALTRLACDHIEYGNAARAEAVIAARAALADSIGQARYRWQSPLLWSMHAMPRGRFDDCEAHIRQARQLAAETPDPNAERCIEFHRFSMLLVAGRPQALRAQEASAQKTLLTLLGNHDLDDWLAAVTAARLGDRRRAIEVLRRHRAGALHGPQRAHHPDRGRRPRRGLRLRRGALSALDAIGQHERVLGAVRVRVHVPDRARAGDGRVRARPTSMRRFATASARSSSPSAWARTRIARGFTSPGARARASARTSSAHSSSRRPLDMPEVAQRARAAAATNGCGRSPRHARAERSASFALRHDRERNEWTIDHAGRSFRLKDLRGLRMLAQLVDQPGREIHALDLGVRGRRRRAAAVAADLGDAGEVIDLRARDAYKARIDELRESSRRRRATATPRARRACATSSTRSRSRSPPRWGSAAASGARDRPPNVRASPCSDAIREAIKKIAEQDADARPPSRLGGTHGDLLRLRARRSEERR